MTPTPLLFGLLTSIVILAVPAGYAETNCTDELELTERGSIVSWDVCHNGQRYSLPATEEGILALQPFAEGERLSPPDDWRRARPEDADGTFTASATTQALRISRTYRRDGRGQLVHEIEITNQSSVVLSDVRLLLDPGEQILPAHSGGQSLADYVYDFHRTHVEAEPAGWQDPAQNSFVRKLALVVRHKTLVVQAIQPSTMRIFAGTPDGGNDDTARSWAFELALGNVNPYETRTVTLKLQFLPTSVQTLGDAQHDGLMYAHLWQPLAALSVAIEVALGKLSPLAGPGVAIILLAVSVRCLTMPLTLWSARRQREFSAISAQMKPEIERARAEHTGAEQSERILQVYREHGVSPFSGLKGSVGLFVQIPFLLAVFNVTTLSSVFLDAEFLWIDNLALADAAATLPASVPFLGHQLNILPVVMGFVFLFAGRLDSNMGSSTTLAVITALIVILFYSFAAALVMYWLTTNALQIGERFLLSDRMANSRGTFRGAQRER